MPQNAKHMLTIQEHYKNPQILKIIKILKY